ncbi:SCO6881 family protein [Streptomyces sp. SID1121]|uniref:SCO6881 family protein n=1 Tax=Streptomyces sp. SID1121 TaxID=3425888 RepID=UPI0040568EFA
MGFCDLPVAGKLCDAADAADFVTNPGEAIGNWIAKSSGELAATAADLAAKAVDTTTRVDLNAAWFRDNYEMILPIGLVMLVGTFCAQLIRAAVKRDGQALAQAFTGTVAGVFFAFSAIALTTVALEVVDALSAGLFEAANTSVDDAVRRIIGISALGSLSGMAWMVPTLVSTAAAIGAFMFWCVMMVRKVGILVLVTLAVFAGAGGGWEVARRWRRGWIEATATLVVSKLLMTIVFLLGISAMGNTQSKDGLAALADALSGIVIMLLVLLCPYATFKFVHWAAEGSDGESLHRAGGAGAQLARQHAEKAARKTASMAATAGTGGAAAAAGASPQGPDAGPGGGFPGDIAANPTSAGGDGGDTAGGSTGISPGGDAVKSGLEKAVQPPPMNVSDDNGGQVGGSPGAGASGPSTVSGQGGGWQSMGPATTPPPQGAPAPSGSQSVTPSGSASPPLPPAGF